jgi:hypothetical protein
MNRLLAILLLLPWLAGAQIQYSSSNGFHFVQGVKSTNFYLTIPQWMDILGRSQPADGVAAPVLTAVTNSSAIKLPGYQQGDISYWTFQLPHNIATTNSSFLLGTNANTTWHLSPHIHFLLNGDARVDSTHTNVTWQMEWQVASINQIFAQGTNSVTKGCTETNMHYIVGMPAVTNNGPYGISAAFVCRLQRIASSSQDLSVNATIRDVCLIDVDLHVPVANTVAFGSRDETSQ